MEYKIEMREYSGFPLGLAILEWTTTPPTVEGWYWTSYTGRDSRPVHYMKDVFGKIRSNNKADDKRAKYWLGPLPVPEPPEKD